MMIALILAIFSASSIYAESTPLEEEDTWGYCSGWYRSVVKVKNNSNCISYVYCHEKSADGKVYYMGYLYPGHTKTIRPSAKNARIYTVANGKENSSLEINGCGLHKTLYVKSCSSSSPCKGEIDKLVIYETGSFRTVTELVDGGTYYLDELPKKFGTEAIIDGDVESVKFTVNGHAYIENIHHYTYPKGDQVWYPSEGTYTIKAEAYSKDNARGTKCSSKTVKITIKKTKKVCGSIEKLIVYESGTFNEVVELVDGGEYSLADFPKKFGTEAIVKGNIESVKFIVNGRGYIENIYHYTYPGGDAPWHATPGHYTFTIKAYSRDKAWGELCDKKTIRFKICADADEDGTCDADDCAPHDPNFPKTPGSACDDGNMFTINDVVGPDGCSCAGECPVIEPEQDLEITICEGDSYTFEVSTNAPGAIYDRVEVVSFSAPVADPYEADGPDKLFLRAIPIPADGQISLPATRLANLTGTQYVYACFKPEPAECREFVQFVVNIDVDSDEDGLCDFEDCAPNDGSLPGTPGTPGCSDGNDLTINDVIGPDGCSCVGVCPVITTEQDLNVTICEGESYTFEVFTDAPGAVYENVEVVAFSARVEDPYEADGPDKLFLRAIPIPADGEISLPASRLANLTGTQYVYACFKPDPIDCREFIEYVVTIEDCVSPFLANQPDAGQAISNSTVHYNGGLEISQDATSSSERVILDNGFSMYQNAPNPFTKETNIAFELPEAGNVTLLVTDVTGKTTMVVDQPFNKGYNTIQFNRNDLSSGIYYYTLQTAFGQVTKKLVIVD